MQKKKYILKGITYQKFMKKKYYELLNQLKKLENILKEREEKIKLLNKRKGFLGNFLQRLIK